MISENKTCYLCGELIDTNVDDADLQLSMDHTPPKQFYPKDIRKQHKLNMQLVPSHKKCNESFRKDEEYFYHSLYPMVAKNNPGMASVIFQDFKRRTQKPQTPAMMRSIVKTASRITKGGIHLPPEVVMLELNNNRLQRVAMKIARGVLCLNGIFYIPESSCIDLRNCQSEPEVPEIYKLSWQASPQPCGDYHKVFSYKYFYFENHHYATLFFWESVMYCLCFEV